MFNRLAYNKGKKKDDQNYTFLVLNDVIFYMFNMMCVYFM